jgi:TRAP-type C4-dicarboxylate transport system permease large subunit
MVLELMVGMLTPPVGLLLFVVAGIGRIPLVAVIRRFCRSSAGRSSSSRS